MSTETTPKTIREIADPDGKLPEVTLEHAVTTVVRSPGKQTAEPLMAKVGDRSVGSAIMHHDAETGEAWLTHPKVEVLGEGYGSSLYLAAIQRAHESGETFRTDKAAISESAVRVWQRFIDKGIAEVVVPFEATGRYRPDGQEFYYGHVEIKPSEPEPK